MQTARRCPRCDELFVPDKFHPAQKYCSDPNCRDARRRQYKSDYNRAWREANPQYFQEYWASYRALK